MRKNNTETKILDAAVKVFAEKGYNSASTKEIAEAAGVAEGTIFRYYKTKRDILLKSLDKVVKIFSDEKALRPISSILEANKDASPQVVLRALIKDRINVFRDNSQLIKIVLTEAQFDDDISKKFYYAVMTKVLPVLLDYLNKGASEGAFRGLGKDGNMVALRIFISIAGGYVLQRSYAPNLIMVDEDKDLDFVVDLFLNGIKA